MQPLQLILNPLAIQASRIITDFKLLLQGQKAPAHKFTVYVDRLEIAISSKCVRNLIKTSGSLIHSQEYVVEHFENSLVGSLSALTQFCQKWIGWKLNLVPVE